MQDLLDDEEEVKGREEGSTPVATRGLWDNDANLSRRVRVARPSPTLSSSPLLF
jgi:hypothetical protein